MIIVIFLQVLTVFFSHWILPAAIAGVVLFGLYLVTDYFGPRAIRLRNDRIFGFRCLSANDLIVHETDKEGNVWATRGMIVYRLGNKTNRFVRIAHIPTGLNLFWLRNFSIVRKLTLRPECVEMVVCSSGTICALSAGAIWRLQAGERRFSRTLNLRHYGKGDQGTRNVGLLSVEPGHVYFGEYFRNKNRTNVFVFHSANDGLSWEVACTFEPGTIRHIHALQEDPNDGKLWICTGDLNEECMVGWSDDGYRTIHPIGQGSQLWRVCQLVFTKDEVYWGTDTGYAPVAGIYKWNKSSNELTKLTSVDGAVFYNTMLSGGTIVMSTDRERMESEMDDKTRLWILPPDGLLRCLVCGTWKSKKPGFWFKFAFMRFQRNQGGRLLVVTSLNQRELPDGKLFIVEEDELIRVSSPHILSS